MAVSLALQIIGGLIAAFLALVWVHRDRAWGARAPLPRYGTAADPRKTWPVGPPASMPFLGNQPQMSANADRYLDNFLEWRQKYGLGYEVSVEH